ncbi:MAG: hypothetical protein QM726_07200 [Chitinophagaceae bacterium]
MKQFLPFAIIIAFIFSSCQKQLQFDTADTGNNNNNGNNTGSSSDCKACVYFPMCDGSQYSYIDTISGAASVRTSTIKIAKDTTIDSKSFQKVYTAESPSTYQYYNCTDGLTRIIAYNGTTLNGNTITVIDLRLISANQPVGTTWTDKITNPLGQEVDYVNTIKSKGISKTVNGQTFSDVIFVEVETGVNAPPIGYFNTNITEYYYAKGVGLVETVLRDATTGAIFQHSVIKSYKLP